MSKDGLSIISHVSTLITTLALLILIGVLNAGVLNYLADILPHGGRLSSIPTRPSCGKCGAQLLYLQWIAWVGRLTRRGRCVYCGARLGPRSVIVELAIMAGMTYLGTSLGLQSRFWILTLLLNFLSLITVIDLEHKVILNVIIVPAAGTALLYGALFGSHGWASSLEGGAAGYGLMYLAYLGGRTFLREMNRRRMDRVSSLATSDHTVAFGRGDVNLAGVIGLAVGWPEVLTAMLIGVLAGGVAALVTLIRRDCAPLTIIPYGPYLALGAALVLLR